MLHYIYTDEKTGSEFSNCVMSIFFDLTHLKEAQFIYGVADESKNFDSQKLKAKI